MIELSNKEKKFLSNQKNMQKIFGAYSEQATILYEYMRALDTEAELFDRFKHLHLRVDSGVQKAQGNLVSNGQTLTKTVNGVQYSQIKLFAMANKSYEYDAYNNKLVQENARLARYKFFNSRTAVLSCRQFHTIVAEQSKRAELPTKSAVLCKNLRTNSAVDLIAMHKTIYHELSHGMAKHTSYLEAPLDSVLPKDAQQYSAKKQVVHYVGVNPVFGYIQSKNNNMQTLWQNVGYKYLEEGVVDSIATECVENELTLNNNNFKQIDKSAMVEKLRTSGSKYSTSLCLVGMWNSISNDELTKQHLGKKSKNLEIAEATEIFKDLFVDYITYLTGNTYNPRTKWTFTTKKMDNILQKYSKCVQFCQQFYFARNGNGAVSQYNQERFGKYHKLATTPEVLAEQIKSYIDVERNEEKYFEQKINELYGYNNIDKKIEAINQKDNVFLLQKDELKQIENTKIQLNKINNFDFAKNNKKAPVNNIVAVAFDENNKDTADSMQR